MVRYELSHLTQSADEAVIGPIQDTEALLLYSVVRGMRMRRVLEIGGLSGYSAANFVAAFAKPAESVVYTVDLNRVPQQAPNHVIIVKDAAQVTPDDINYQPLDMVFFDCHVYDAQMTLFKNLVEAHLITPRTIIALHDTHTHPRRVVDFAYRLADTDEWVHQPVERRMVNEFVDKHGYHAFSLHTPHDSHDESMPFRHGLTLLQKFSRLAT